MIASTPTTPDQLEEKNNMATSSTTLSTLTLPDAPNVDGLMFRRFQGEPDYARMIAVVNACRPVDGLEWVSTVEKVAYSYAHLKNSDPYQDMIFAQAAGQVIGYGRVEWFQENRGSRIYVHFGYVDPGWRRRGIGQAMLRWQERRLREIATQHPLDGPRFFQDVVYDSEIARNALVRREGYAPAALEALMVRPGLEDIPEMALPEGLEVRPVQPEHWRTIWEAAREAFSEHWGEGSPDDADYERMIHDPDFNPSLWQVAWEGDQVVGVVHAFIDQKENACYNRQRGWTEGICVRKPWRQRGVARALIARALRALKERGMQEAALTVHTDNPNQALRLYESMGFRTQKMQLIYRKPMD